MHNELVNTVSGQPLVSPIASDEIHDEMDCSYSYKIEGCGQKRGRGMINKMNIRTVFKMIKRMICPNYFMIIRVV